MVNAAEGAADVVPRIEGVEEAADAAEEERKI